MPLIVDNIELDETNVEFSNAADFVRHTDRIIFLTGKAGTGKTTFLKYLKQTTNKNTVILAPTGVAAINAGGQTIHSFFQIKPSIYVPNDKRLRKKSGQNDVDKSTIYDHFKYFKERLELIRGMELLVIDEISMVRCDLLDVVDRLLRVYRRREFEPFGGVQVILIGDTFQLPPIAEFDQWEILNRFYESPFFFSAKVIKENKPIYIELKKIYRQNEKEFIELLNRIRINQINQNELNILNSKFNPTFFPDKNSNYITLATHNNIVNNTNLTKLNELPTELKLFEAITTGTFPDNIMLTDRILQLKENAQIMFIKNDKQKRFYNGKIAKIKSVVDNKIIVEFSEGNEITVEKETWNNIRYSWNEKEHKVEEDVIGTFTQFPVKLAWAITVHKSQGLTFEKIIADLGAAFTSGQVYVALSRCTSFNGLVLKTRIERNAIKTDPQVLTFAQNEMPNTLIIQELNAGKADFYYKKAREALHTNDFISTLGNFKSAIKFRNDIETETFKRYVVTFLSRLSKNRTLANEVSKQIGIVKDELSDLNESYEKLQDELDKEKTVSQKTINSLRLELSTFKENVSKVQRLNKNLETKNFEQEKIIKLQEQEIDRLRNQKWYEKLFGSK